MEDGGVIGHMALEELYLGDGDEILHQEALVQAAYPGPLTPGASLLTTNKLLWSITYTRYGQGLACMRAHKRTEIWKRDIIL